MPPYLTTLFPDLAERDDDVDGFLHILTRYPFEPRMEVVFAGKEIGRRQAHERQPRAVGPAADGLLDDLEAAPPDRLACVLDHVGMAVEHGPHVAVLLGDGDLDARPGKRGRRLARPPLDQRLLGREPRRVEV